MCQYRVGLWPGDFFPRQAAVGSAGHRRWPPSGRRQDHAPSGRARRDDDIGFGMACRHGIVDGLSVIGAISDRGGNRPLHLIEQVRQGSDIADVICREVAGDDLLAPGINSNMELASAPARADAVLLVQPLSFAIDLEAGAVDQQMHRLISPDPLRQNGQAHAPAAEGRVVGHLDRRPQQADDRSQRPSVWRSGR
jgi:hypothetical protein